jgi:two-component system, OmpR family, sensor kinase
MAVTRPPSGRLFWKLLLALWLGTVLSMSATVMYFKLTGVEPPDEGNRALLFGFVPVAPLAVGTLTMLVTSLGLAWYLARPLHHLSWALRRVAEGHLDTRVQDRMGGRRDEIVDLAADFDGMARQLQALTESRTALLHDISHELRSPLTRLQVAIGLLRQEPAQSEQMLARIEREAQRLDALIEQLLTWHRLEAGAAAAHPSRVDVIELLHAIGEDAQFEAQAQGKDVQLIAAGTFVCDVHGELIYRAYENVIRNAIKFTAAHGEVIVTVRVSPGDETLLCSVEDRGPGVPQEMLETIFHPFTRVAGSEGVQGVGLGLAIARRAFELHGGSIHAQARDGGGLSVIMALPQRQIYTA